MRDQVLWRKVARIADLLAGQLDIDAERALNRDHGVRFCLKAVIDQSLLI